jgi:hypothetical protein
MPRRQNQLLVRDEEHVMPPWLTCIAEFAGGSASAESSIGQ